jgi:hypothetical protein
MTAAFQPLTGDPLTSARPLLVGLVLESGMGTFGSAEREGSMAAEPTYDTIC